MPVRGALLLVLFQGKRIVLVVVADDVDGGELERIGGDHLQLHAALIALHGFSLFDLVGIDHDGGITFGTDNSHRLSLRSLEVESDLWDAPSVTLRHPPRNPRPGKRNSTPAWVSFSSGPAVRQAQTIPTGNWFQNDAGGQGAARDGCAECGEMKRRRDRWRAPAQSR